MSEIKYTVQFIPIFYFSAQKIRVKRVQSIKEISKVLSPASID